MSRFSRIALALAILTINACAVDAMDEGAAEQLGEVEEEIGIGAPLVHARYSRHFGGNIAAEHHYPVVGAACRPGYERGVTGAAAPKVTFTGNGGCAFQEWLNPSNPTDCRARLHVWTNAFWGGGTCDATIFEQRSTVYTCQTRTRTYCGGAGPVDATTPEPVCFCDDSCSLYNDCCPDKHLVCDR
jgi:hypothetical protein